MRITGFDFDPLSDNVLFAGQKARFSFWPLSEIHHIKQNPFRKPKGISLAFIALLLQAELLIELINASAAVDKLLLTCEERVALGADFYLDVLLGRTGLDHITAGALNGSRLIIGMNTLFHHVTAFSIFFSQRGSNPFGIFSQ